MLVLILVIHNAWTCPTTAWLVEGKLFSRLTSYYIEPRQWCKAPEEKSDGRPRFSLLAELSVGGRWHNGIKECLMGLPAWLSQPLSSCIKSARKDNRSISHRLMFSFFCSRQGVVDTVHALQCGNRAFTVCEPGSQNRVWLLSRLKVVD